MYRNLTYAEACLARMFSGVYRLKINDKSMRNMEPVDKN